MVLQLVLLLLLSRPVKVIIRNCCMVFFIVIRFFLHDALDNVTYVVNGRVFDNPSKLFDHNAEDVRLKYFGRVDDRGGLSFSPIVSNIFVDNKFYRINVDDGDLV